MQEACAQHTHAMASSATTQYWEVAIQLLQELDAATIKAIRNPKTKHTAAVKGLVAELQRHSKSAAVY